MTPETESFDTVRDAFHEHIEEQSLDGFYRNFGDANPEYHGGIWIAYNVDREAFDVYITFHAAEVGLADPDRDDPGLQYVETAEIDLDRVIDLDGSWSDAFDHVPETYHRGHPSPMGAVVDRELTGYVAHEAHKWADTHDVYHPDDPVVEEDTYDEVLDSFGIEPRDE